MEKKKPRAIDPVISELMNRGSVCCFDYGFIMDSLRQYRSPKAKLTQLIQAEALIRLKRGMYVFGDEFRKKDLCLEVVANLLYGPSYVSLEWALQYYQMIPEKVVEVTSVTTKRKSLFQTPIGRFSFTHLPQVVFPHGVTWVSLSNNESFLVATPEKALADLIRLKRGKVTSVKEMHQILLEDLRIEEEDILKLDFHLLQVIHDSAPHSGVKFLIRFIEERRRS